MLEVKDTGSLAHSSSRQLIIKLTFSAENELEYRLLLIQIICKVLNDCFKINIGCKMQKQCEMGYVITKKRVIRPNTGLIIVPNFK